MSSTNNARLLMVRIVGLVAGMFLSSLCQADRFCFLQAQSYYEQLFCEVKAQGKGSKLPRFDEFKRSSQITQALLLKHPAKSAGLTVIMPKRSNEANIESPIKSTKSTASKTGAMSNCVLQDALIECGTRRYQMLGNLSNQRLKPGSLEESSRLELPEYTGDSLNRDKVLPYLLKAYRHYVNKMMDIGLAGATMSYGTFEYLFNDLRDKGVDFNKRFETMYRYLKQDKKNIHVSETITTPGSLRISDCGVLDQQLIACVVDGRNYLYRRSVGIIEPH